MQQVRVECFVPATRKSGVLHGTHWLDVKIQKIHSIVLERGKDKFGDEFKVSWPMLLRLKPFQVRTAGREVSELVCRNCRSIRS